jgi:hypothetical protein
MSEIYFLNCALQALKLIFVLTNSFGQVFKLRLTGMCAALQRMENEEMYNVKWGLVC